MIIIIISQSLWWHILYVLSDQQQEFSSLSNMAKKSSKSEHLRHYNYRAFGIFAWEMTETIIKIVVDCDAVVV